MEEKFILWGMIILITIALAFSVVHNFEASVYVRCNGEPIFPHSEEDIKDSIVIGGNMKLDNAILVNLKLKGIELHEPITQNSVKSTFVRNKCNYERMSKWEFR